MSRFHCERRFHLHFSWLLTFQFQIDIFNIEFSCGGYSNCYFFSRNSYCFIDKWLIPSGKISVSFSPSREEERAKSSATPMRWNIVHVSNELIRYCIPNHPEILLQQMISILLNPRGHSLNGEYALTRVHKACHATRISKMIPRAKSWTRGCENYSKNLGGNRNSLARRRTNTTLNQWRIRTKEKLSLSTNDFSRCDFLLHFTHESFYFQIFF